MLAIDGVSAAYCRRSSAEVNRVSPGPTRRPQLWHGLCERHASDLDLLIPWGAPLCGQGPGEYPQARVETALNVLEAGIWPLCRRTRSPYWIAMRWRPSSETGEHRSSVWNQEIPAYRGAFSGGGSAVADAPRAAIVHVQAETASTISLNVPLKCRPRSRWNRVHA